MIVFLHDLFGYYFSKEKRAKTNKQKPRFGAINDSGSGNLLSFIVSC